MVRLWLVKLPAEIPQDPKQKPKPEALTEGEKFSVTDFTWAPDSKRIAFAATRDPDLSSSATGQIYVLDVESKGVTKLLKAAGPHTRPRWWRAARQIAFVTWHANPFF